MRCKTGMTVQSILFARDAWNVREARRWLRAHGHKGGTPDETDEYLRFRQKTPRAFRQFRTIDFGDGIKAVVGCPR